jgi:hypothetical protein
MYLLGNSKYNNNGANVAMYGYNHRIEIFHYWLEGNCIELWVVWITITAS